MKRIFKIVAVNIMVLLALLSVIEGTFRIFNIKRAPISKTIFGSKFAPYTMFINQPNWKDNPYQVFDTYQMKVGQGKKTTNNWGFPTKENFDFAGLPIEKKVNEKLVLLTGGSAAAGAGATADDQLITAAMERILNSSQDTYHYKVINFSNGGWIASQEFIGLALWGRSYNPDWVITMDGRNDIAIAYDLYEGPGFPKHYHQMESYVRGYMEEGQGISFYRGWLENLILKYSLAYRTLTRKTYIGKTQQLIKIGDLAVVANPNLEDLKGKQIDRMVQFYANSLENITGLFQDAKYILSIQPLSSDYANIFQVSEKVLDDAAALLHKSDCKDRVFYLHSARMVFYNNSIKAIQTIIEKYKGKRYIDYYNIGEIFPPAGNDRLRFFFDEVHMHDAGQELVGVFYAYKILASDFPGKKANFEFELKNRLESLIAKNAQK
ncbi:MAG: hypothetical protein HY787_23590 [Deltaproteobacteria bacterium]|nr:hypothetical protein [Deltaproteobacteria bacterium]